MDTFASILFIGVGIIALWLWGPSGFFLWLFLLAFALVGTPFIVARTCGTPRIESLSPRTRERIALTSIGLSYFILLLFSMWLFMPAFLIGIALVWRSQLFQTYEEWSRATKRIDVLEPDDFTNQMLHEVVKQTKKIPCPELELATHDLIRGLYPRAKLINEPLPFPPPMHFLETTFDHYENPTRFRQSLASHVELVNNPTRLQTKVFQPILRAISLIWENLPAELFVQPPKTGAVFTTPATSRIGDKMAHQWASKFESIFNKNRTLSHVFDLVRGDPLQAVTSEEWLSYKFANPPFYAFFSKILFLPAQGTLTFSREHRFRHAFIVGPSGAGKTTLLSHFIKEALEKVARNEASVFVMDSQNELVRWIAHNKIFAKGGALEGKLIYLEPSVTYPLALNIFDFSSNRLEGLSEDDQQTVKAETAQMVRFFMESLVGSDASGFVTGILNYAMRALEKIPDANIEHLLQLTDKGGFQTLASKYPRLDELSERDKKFLSRDMYEQQASLTSMRNRLLTVMSDDRFTSMFLQKNKFDLYDALGSSWTRTTRKKSMFSWMSFRTTALAIGT